MSNPEMLSLLIPAKLRRQIQQQAKLAERTVSAEVRLRLQQSFQQQSNRPQAATVEAR
ncbi:MAG: hypothetical protein ACYDDI_01025 [Candidatus Acidiferrales bacterium]